MRSLCSHSAIVGRLRSAQSDLDGIIPSMLTQETKLLPLNAMARRLRVTVRWLRAEAESGRVPALKAGERYLFDQVAVEDVLVARARGRVQQPSVTASEGRRAK